MYTAVSDCAEILPRTTYCNVQNPNQHFKQDQTLHLEQTLITKLQANLPDS